MSSLWLGFAVLLLVAVVFLLVPLLKQRKTDELSGSDAQQDNVLIFRDRLAELEAEKEQGTLEESAYQALKAELEKSLLQDVTGKQQLTYQNQPVQVQQAVVIFAVVFVLMIFSIAIYLHLGRSDDYADYLALKEQGETMQVSADAPQQKAPDFAKAVEMLEKKLAENPDDFDKYVLLANSYAAMGNFKKSAEVYATLAERIGPDNEDYALVKGSYAQSLFQAEGEQFTEEVNVAVDQALAADSQESTALMLKGIQAYMQNNFALAIELWQQAKVKSSKVQIERFIEPAIADARSKAGMPAEAVVATTKAAQPVTHSGAKIIVNLSLAPELLAKVKPQDTVFVFARAVGGRMPLAIERLQVKDLPKRIVLDDSKAAMPTATLSTVEQVDIIARVSFSGTPQAQAGDLFVQLEQVKVNADKELNLVINQVQP
ncbi:MAG: c-type cytochrome biogenesis protein CcmI [Methyloprofundus sp.]|nr:c-type cytochrome biogenesis protein CcmI [Methyloprofundus sp.]MBW6452353.1 c-type cytochrome biogenesis protein CcmI [Methyloprofundus sp.]